MQTLYYEGFKMYIHVAVEMWQNLKQFLNRMHDNRTMNESYAT